MSRLTRFAALAAVASVALTACGDDNQDAGSSSTSVVASLSTVTGDSTAVAPGGSTAGTVGVDGGLEMRAKIISLSPSATETLFAIGAGSLVIAVDDQSNYPAEATKLPHDLSGYQPNAEAIAALKPDVVIHDGTTELEAQLDKVGIKSFIGAAPKS
ncbi:MAG TPA: ABC transporter substrate-binding protein, partial [Ilumatobacteraceae bacterium]|nr:ABC transporter substrate-binding protein [Ilumatobacteraceae bacterium]